MADRHGRMRHVRVAQHALLQWEKSRVSRAPIPSGHAEESTNGGHAYPHASPSYSSCRRRVSPTNASLPSSPRRRQVSPIQALEVFDSSVVPEAPSTANIANAFAPMPPTTIDVAETVPPPNGEAAQDVEAEAFGRGPVKLSLLPLYSDHNAIHIWDGKVALVGLILYIGQ